MKRSWKSVAVGSSLGIVFLSAILTAQSKSVWQLVPDVRIDGEVSDLTMIGMSVVSESGDLYVTQPMEGIIRVFDQTGKPKRTIGKPGAGPGEFRKLGTIGFLGDTLYAVDSELRRITLFSPLGRVVRTVQHAPSQRTVLKSDTMLAWFLGFSVLGLVNSRQSIAFPIARSADLGSGRFHSLPLYLTDEAGTPVRQLVTIRRAHSTMQIKGKTGSITYTAQPLSDDPLFAVDPTGKRIVIVDSDPRRQVLTLNHVGSAGEKLLARSVPFLPSPIPKRVVDSLVTSLRSMLAVSRIDADPRAALYVPHAYPGATRIHLERNGTVWLRVSRLDESAHRWQIISPNGEVLATVAVPRNTDIRTVDRGIWATVRNADDVESLVRLRLRKQ